MNTCKLHAVSVLSSSFHMKYGYKSDQPKTLKLTGEVPKSNQNPKMPIIKLLFIALSLCLFLLQTCDSVSILDLDNALRTSEVDVMVRRVCTKKLEDCLEDQEMESESSRRVLLMQKKYISYETLRRDMVPCGKPGASYYDCNAGQANPYTRGCEVITRCARGIKDIKT